MRVYIASPFFNEKQLELVKKIEHELEAHSIQYYSPRLDGVLKDMSREERRKNAQMIYNRNIENIEDSDWILAVIDNFDPGTVFEIGFAAAIGKRIVTLSNENYGLNVMLAQCVEAHVLNVNDAVTIINGELPSAACIPESAT
jgi:nucleoside deoxyribosyltransferase